MHILMITTDFPPVVGGISAHVYELSKALIAAGQQVTVLARQAESDVPKNEVLDGLNVHRMPHHYPGFLYGLEIARAAKKIIKKSAPDLIHIHGMRPLEWFDASGLPLVYTNHTSGYLKRIKKGSFRRIYLLKRLFGKVDLFLAPSHELLEIPFDIAAPKVFVSNGVDSEKYTFSEVNRVSLKKKLKLKDDDIVGLATRRLVEKNGVIFLAQALKYIDDPKFKLVIVGDGPERKKIENEVAESCPDKVIFAGEMNHSDVISYYSAADFSILPSLMEATSISGLEAMAAGLPLVGTRVGGIPELIHDGDNGYLCEPANPQDLAEKINLLLRSDIGTLGEASRKMVKADFSWSRIAEKTLAAYGQVL